MTIHPALTIIDKRLCDFIHTDFEIIVLDNKCNFSEGPVWNAEGYYLFSDIPENKVCKIAPGIKKEDYLQPSGFTGEDDSFLSEQVGSNGLTYDHNGNLLLCQHGNGAVAKYDGKQLFSYINNYKGRRFNSPNDIVVHNDGSIFFSDPPYGLKNQQLVPERFQPKAGFYCWRNGELELFCTEFQYPNGICLSPDQQYLYCCSAKSSEKKVLMYDAATLQLITVVAEESSDGIKCDAFGNLYLCTHEGLVILNTEGRRMGIIELDTEPANIAWGGSNGKDLLVTARQNIFLIQNLQKKE